MVLLFFVDSRRQLRIVLCRRVGLLVNNIECFDGATAALLLYKKLSFGFPVRLFDDHPWQCVGKLNLLVRIISTENDVRDCTK